jgi:hypothetical protein
MDTVSAEVERVAATGAFQGDPGRDGSNVVPTAQVIASEIATPGTPANQAIARRSALNILDYGVSTGTVTSQTAATKAALDSKPGQAFYFPPGDYRLDTPLVISQKNSIITQPGTRFYAGAAMDTLITYTWEGTGYAEDKGIYGPGLFDGALLAKRGISIKKVIKFTMDGSAFRDFLNRGLVLEEGLGAEFIGNNLRFYNTGATNYIDNIAIEANMGDSHFSHIVTRDWTVAFKDTKGNRWDRCHPWISQDASATGPNMTNRYPLSIGFDLNGPSDLTMCVADTAPPRLLNCRAMWAVNPMLTTALAAANPATVFDNTAGIGFISDRFTATGHGSTTRATWITGPTINLDISRTTFMGYITDAQGTELNFDYVKGVQQGTFTFTPTIYGSTGAGTHTYNSRSGRMVVNKDEVGYFIDVNATLDATTAFAGGMRIGGIPVPTGSTNLRNVTGSIGWVTGVSISNALIFAGSAPYVTLSTLGASGTTEVDIPGQGLRGKTVSITMLLRGTHFKA